jgi:threonine dehydrogenase-like Zn-dependent dehydrogenase
VRAWRFHGGLEDMRLDEVPDPAPGVGEVLLRVRVVEPSVTEAVLVYGAAGASGYEQALADGPAQLFGHELCGEVIEAGPGVERLAVGDRVGNRSFLPCLECALCLSGRSAACRRGPRIGFQLPGCLAELAVLPEHALVVLPDAVSDYEGATIQPAADCVAALDSARLLPSDTVAVIGQGMMGIHTMQVARALGVAQVIAIDVRDEPLALAAELGADHCVNAASSDAVAAVMALTDGVGADVAIECAGGPPAQGLAGSASIEQALAVVRDSGRVVLNSIVPGRTGLDLLAWRMRSIELVFPMMAEPRHLELTVQLVADGKLRLDPLISHVVWGLDQVPKAFEITADKATYRATGPCQVVVDTDSVAPHPRVMEPAGSAR